MLRDCKFILPTVVADIRFVFAGKKPVANGSIPINYRTEPSFVRFVEGSLLFHALPNASSVPHLCNLARQLKTQLDFQDFRLPSQASSSTPRNSSWFFLARYLSSTNKRSWFFLARYLPVARFHWYLLE